MVVDYYVFRGRLEVWYGGFGVIEVLLGYRGDSVWMFFLGFRECVSGC